MGVAYLLLATERSELANSAPTRDQITAALRNVADRSRRWTNADGSERYRSIGHWVGPGPRVTRVVELIGTGNAFRTRVAWIYGVEDAEERAYLATTAAKQQFADNLARDAFAELEARAGRPNLLRDNWTVTVTGYAPAENGDPAWWESGGASRDAVWVDTFPPLVPPRLPDDNPSGPNPTHPNQAPPDYLNTVLWIVGGVAVAAVAIEFGPAIASWVPKKSKTPNPRHRR